MRKLNNLPLVPEYTSFLPSDNSVIMIAFSQGGWSMTYWWNWWAWAECPGMMTWTWSWWSRRHIPTWRSWYWESQKAHNELLRVRALFGRVALWWIWSIDFLGLKRRAVIHCWTWKDRLTERKNELLNSTEVFRKYIDWNEHVIATSKLLGAVDRVMLGGRGSHTGIGSRLRWSHIFSYWGIKRMREENILVTEWFSPFFWADIDWGKWKIKQCLFNFLGLKKKVATDILWSINKHWHVKVVSTYIPWLFSTIYIHKKWHAPSGQQRTKRHGWKSTSLPSLLLTRKSAQPRNTSLSSWNNFMTNGQYLQ